MTTQVKEVKTVSGSENGPVGAAFSIPDVTGVRVGVRRAGRIYYTFSVTKFSKGWSVRDGRKVISRRLADSTAQKKIQRKVAELKSSGTPAEQIVVVGHRREAAAEA